MKSIDVVVDAKGVVDDKNNNNNTAAIAAVLLFQSRGEGEKERERENQTCLGWSLVVVCRISLG